MGRSLRPPDPARRAGGKHGKRLSPELETGSPVAAVYDRRGSLWTRPWLFCRPVPASFCAGWRRTVSLEAPGAGRASGFARRAENSGNRPGYGGTVHQTWLRAAGARHGWRRARRSQPGREAARNQLYPRNGYGGARPRRRAHRRAVRPQKRV